jgi:hypothetical protein
LDSARRLLLLWAASEFVAVRVSAWESAMVSV